MLDPRKVNLSRKAFEGDMLLVGIDNAYAYDNGKRTDVVTAVRCNVVLPAYDYEKLTVKLPVGTVVDTALVGQAVDFLDFLAKVYAVNEKVGFSATASGAHPAKH